jgi:hypothetical protein
MEKFIVKSWKNKTKITKTFTSKFQVITMEVNALIFLFTFILDIEENNVANLVKLILMVMDHYL